MKAGTFPLVIKGVKAIEQPIPLLIVIMRKLQPQLQLPRKIKVVLCRYSTILPSIILRT